MPLASTFKHDQPFVPNSLLLSESVDGAHLREHRLSCLFRKVGESEIFGLIPRGKIQSGDEGSTVLDTYKRPIGELIYFITEFSGEDAASMNHLFWLDALNTRAIPPLAESAIFFRCSRFLHVSRIHLTRKRSSSLESRGARLETAAYTRNFYENIFSGGLVRARKLPLRQQYASWVRSEKL